MRQRGIAHFLWLFSMLALLLCPTIADAHAYIDQSTPIQESEIEESPTQIRVQFSESINTNLSTLTLLDAAGNTIPGTKEGMGDNGLVLHIKPLEDGVYKVVWQVLSVDTHVTEGSYRFAVGVPLPKARPAETQSLDEPESEPAAASTSAPEAQTHKQEKPIANTPAAPAQAVVKQPVVTVDQEKKAEEAAVTPGQNAKQEQPRASEAISTIAQGGPSQGGKAEQGTKASEGLKTPEVQKGLDAKSEALPAEEGSVADVILETKGQKDPTAANSSEPAPLLHAHEHDSPSPSHAVHTRIRIVEILIATMLGAMVFLRCWKPFGEMMGGSIQRDAGAERFLLAASLVVFVVAGASHVYGLAAQLQGTTGKVGDLALTILSTTLIGFVSWFRPVLVLLLMLLARWTSWRETVVQMGRAGLIVLLMLTFPLTGHAMGSTGSIWIPILLHTIHFLAGAVWTGGLAGLTIASFTLNKEAKGVVLLHKATAHFSRIALFTIGVVIATGLVLSADRLDDMDQLITSSYGSTLLVKLSIFVVALILAGYHRFYLLPRIHLVMQAGENGGEQINVSSLFHSLRAEFVIACAVLIAAGFLSTTAPPQ
ncbi:copper resistance CopC/CopD family protein [Brevibacillus migulae]|uniref:copper resistance CopC/CopD family protein n=1 Tax=Brevibacillus migulae TaxID=1644114 RepID=UPI00106EE3DA|nr:CopD family protein [Brevibacillus migulae]